MKSENKSENYFAENLRKLRKRKGMSQTILAEKINELSGAKLRHNVISNYENGLTMPSLGIVPTIASILNTSVDFLLGIGQGKGAGDMEMMAFSKDDRLNQIKQEQLNLEPFLHIPRVTVENLNKQAMQDLIKSQYDLIDQLLKEITRLKDDNINTKEKLLNLREKFEIFMGK